MADRAEPDRSRRWAAAPLFQGLSLADLDAVAACLVARPFAAGEVLIDEGVWAGKLFLIRTGIVEITLDAGAAAPALPGEPDRAVALRRLAGGDCFGEMSLITGALPSATARALTDGEVWTLNQQDFQHLALAHPELMRNINAILSERLLHTSRLQSSREVAQVVVAVSEATPLWRDLASEMARLARHAVLLVDFTMPEDTSPTSILTLDDLLNGRLRAAAPAGAALTVVRGAVSAAGLDLPGVLGRLGDNYHYLLVVLPPGHPAVTTPLLTYADRIVVAASSDALPRLRALLAALPLPQGHQHASPRVILLDTPRGLPITAGSRELLSTELGAPVEALLPADPAALPIRVTALARWLTNQRIGLAFGAGGAKGYAHLGVLRALRRLNMPIDCVAGASIGAIVGAGAAMEVSLERIERAFAIGPSHVFHPTIPLYGISSSRSLQAFFRTPEMYGDLCVEDLPTPFAVSAADLTEGREIVVRKGPLWRAVLASAAIPGIYPPVQVGRHWLADGGVVNPVPVSTAQLLGADVVVAVDLSEPLAPRREPDFDSPAAHRPPPLPTTILRARDIMMSEIRAHTAGEPGILIKPRIAGVSIREFAKGAQFLEAGEAAVAAMLPRLRAQFPWLD